MKLEIKKKQEKVTLVELVDFPDIIHLRIGSEMVLSMNKDMEVVRVYGEDLSRVFHKIVND